MLRLYDKKTTETVAELETNQSWCIDDLLDYFNIEVNEEGQLQGIFGGELINAWYEDLEMEYT